ncbi:MAG TPA: long-chain fatty acid--CoA ligase, partial [Alphaproteobacteria bacterium]|nr:long-chain fatty acid--CoA ligase [Alphaproteobacteria bacterium]
IFTDLTFLPILEKIASQIGRVEKIIVLTDGKHMPATALTNAIAYEEWIAGVDEDYRWAKIDENQACGLCYTSGTTGNPKGVLYSHRSNVIHGLAANTADCFGLRSTDSVLPVVPMFH